MKCHFDSDCKICFLLFVIQLNTCNYMNDSPVTGTLKQASANVIYITSMLCENVVW